MWLGALTQFVQVPSPHSTVRPTIGFEITLDEESAVTVTGCVPDVGVTTSLAVFVGCEVETVTD